MATYLLKADDSVMTRWREVAKERGVSFAEFMRAAIEAEIANPRPIREPESGGKVFRGPDPKPSTEPKKKRW